MCIRDRFFGGLAAVGQALAQRRAERRPRAGSPNRGAVAQFHSALTGASRRGVRVRVGRLGPTNVVAGAFSARRAPRLEPAVARNPKAPGWAGLGEIVSVLFG
eukprot:6323817-Lingulodinium_polyedra.AAC.1